MVNKTRDEYFVYDTVLRSCVESLCIYCVKPIDHSLLIYAFLYWALESFNSRYHNVQYNLHVQFITKIIYSFM